MKTRREILKALPLALGSGLIATPLLKSYSKKDLEEATQGKLEWPEIPFQTPPDPLVKHALAVSKSHARFLFIGPCKVRFMSETFGKGVETMEVVGIWTHPWSVCTVTVVPPHNPSNSNPYRPHLSSLDPRQPISIRMISV